MAQNSNSAPNIIDVTFTDQDVVACDGERGALGHPRVYLELHENGEVTCPYCSRKFIRE